MACSFPSSIKIANDCAEKYNIKAVTVEEIFQDKEIEIILNLTIPRAHFEVSKKTLENGKHSYAEKPMSVNFKDGKELVAIVFNLTFFKFHTPGSKEADSAFK